MSLRVANPLWRWAILAVAVVAAICLPLTSIRNWQADHAAAANNISGYERAAQLEPGFGFYWYALGANRRLDIDNPNPQEAIADFQHSLADDPRDASTWMDLGDASEETGDIPGARRAFESAIDAYPDSSDVHWRYGSFLLRQGDTRNAYAQIRLALVITPDLTPLVISRVWRATQDTDALLTQVLPNSGYYGYALTWFCGDVDPDAALATWKKIVASAPSLELASSFPLINLLLQSYRGDEARMVWHQALNLSGHGAEVDSGPSLIFDGGFEFDAVNGGLDWHLDPRDGVDYSYDTAQHHEGSRSLRVTFDGSENFDFHHVSQQVPVKPSTRYRFSAFLRTADITTESGMRFVITFPENFLSPLVLNSINGDKDWTEETADFSTSPQVHSVTIMLARLPSRKFDNKLRGSVWVDSVSLIPAGEVKAAQ